MVLGDARLHRHLIPDGDETCHGGFKRNDMRNSVLFVILLVAISLTSCKTQRVVQGPQGKIATTLRMPRGVDGRCFGIFRLGRDYLTQTQQLDIYGTSADYHGPVCLIGEVPG